MEKVDSWLHFKVLVIHSHQLIAFWFSKPVEGFVKEILFLLSCFLWWLISYQDFLKGGGPALLNSNLVQNEVLVSLLQDADDTLCFGSDSREDAITMRLILRV
jgi:hypothetical protein